MVSMQGAHLSYSQFTITPLEIGRLGLTAIEPTSFWFFCNGMLPLNHLPVYSVFFLSWCFDRFMWVKGFFKCTTSGYQCVCMGDLRRWFTGFKPPKWICPCYRSLTIHNNMPKISRLTLHSSPKPPKFLLCLHPCVWDIFSDFSNRMRRGRGWFVEIVFRQRHSTTSLSKILRNRKKSTRNQMPTFNCLEPMSKKYDHW